MSDEFMHYGILRKSGRYPWGSGEDSYSRSMDFYAYVDSLKKNGIPDADIAKLIGTEAQNRTGDPRIKFTTADLRSARTIAREEKVREETRRITELRYKKQMSPKAISEKLGIAEPTVRLRLKNADKEQKSSLRVTADLIRKNVDDHQIVDIGKGTELNIDAGVRMGISPERLKAAVSVLRDEGYETYTLPVRQPGTKQFTNQKVIVPPGTGFGNARRMTDKIHTMGEWTEDGGKTFFGIHEPLSVSSKRLKVVFAEDGGTDADGVVYIRPGVKDLDMGKNTYAQVRIAVDGTHYIKGMAVKKDDLPDGVDMVFNTNKKRGTPILGDKNNSVLKPLTSDPDNPFGSMISRQIVSIDPKTGKERVTSALNLVNEQGDWNDWRKSLPSQMLAKQPHSLIKSQLKVTRDEAKSRIDEINKITNPIVRKKALEDYADQLDADAVDLRAAAMPRQATKVIIPLPKMNKDEIYAPTFESGERVVLVRYPHGGRFEIPEVTVNNNNRSAKKLLGNAPDAIGIHPSVAERLSGADFDGDTVVVIPNRAGKIKGSKPANPFDKRALNVYEEGLKNFDPKNEYGGYDPKANGGKGNFKLMKNTGLEMGMITNLITDMSIQGAQPEHVVRAVRHSMVVIDAEKHQLDYKRSEDYNGIKQLRKLYQATEDNPKKAGASTLLSQATARDEIPERKNRSAAKGGPVDPNTGARVYEPTNRMVNVYDRKTGTYTEEKRVATQKEKRLSLTDNAFDLTRDPNNPIEKSYAEHANEMKALANSTRLRALRIPNPPTNKKAKAEYKAEVDKLVSDLKAANKQAPLRRRANVYANQQIKMKMQEDPSLRVDLDRKKKVERQARDGALARLGLRKPVIDIDDRQWDAIQSGAVSPSMLRQILVFADPKRVQELSMPRANPVMTGAMVARAKAMLNAGATNAEIAASLGIPQSTLRAAAVRGEL